MKNQPLCSLVRVISLNLATIGTIAALLPNCVVFSDELNHNSMIAGIQISRAKKHIFRHNDVDHLKELLSHYPKSHPKCDRVRIGVLDGRRLRPNFSDL